MFRVYFFSAESSMPEDPFMSGAIMISKSGVVLNPRTMDLSPIDGRFGDKVVLAKVAKLCGIN